MFCQNCGNKLKSEINFCGNCGFKVSGTADNSISRELHVVSKRYSGVTPQSKFIILYFATLSFYTLFWMYDQWVFLKKRQGLKISPGWRAFFATLWAGVLANDVQKLLKRENIHTSYSPVLIGVSFFILSVLYKLPDPYWLVSFLSFLPVLPIVEAMNQYYEKHDSHLPKRKLTWWQTSLTVLGLLFFLLAVYGTINP